MKKIGRLIKKNSKILIAFIIGLIIAGGGAYVAALTASEVTYTGNGQSTVNGALNDLYTRANRWINPSVLNGNGYYTNKARNMIATSQGILLIRNGNTHFIKANDWANEQTHIQQVFSDDSCDAMPNGVSCYASGFTCDVYSDGNVYCNAIFDYSGCEVDSGGEVGCN